MKPQWLFIKLSEDIILTRLFMQIQNLPLRVFDKEKIGLCCIFTLAALVCVILTALKKILT